MLKLIRTLSRKTGLPPGSPVYVGAEQAHEPRVRVIDYSADALEEKDSATIDDCFAYRDRPSVTWINVDGVHDVKMIERLGAHFGLHPLVVEDIVNTAQRPKVEDFGTYAYIVFKMLRYDDEKGGIQSEQVSLILGKGFVLSFQEREGDVFNEVRERLRQGSGRVRRMGPDYLAYALMDAVVDNYFLVLERLGENLEKLEEEVLESDDPRLAARLRRLRGGAILLRKPVWPLRETVSALQRMESPLLSDTLRPYLADLYDHVIQVADGVEMLRDLVGSLRETHLSMISHRMNEVMKVLTIIATIFIPITFVAGIYGMNFETMPELKWPYGYPVVLGLMAAIAAGMVLYFRRKRWL